MAKPNPVSHLAVPGAALSAEETVDALSLPAAKFNLEENGSRGANSLEKS